MQNQTFDFMPQGQGAGAPVSYGAPAAKMGSQSDPIHLLDPDGRDKVDSNLQQELADIEKAEHVQPSAQGMEYQIQQLVSGQRQILQEFERLKDHLTENAKDIEELKRVAGFANEHMAKGHPAQPQQSSAPAPHMNQSAAPAVKKEAKASVNENLGYRGGVVDWGNHMETMRGHYNTAASYMGRGGGGAAGGGASQ